MNTSVLSRRQLLALAAVPPLNVSAGPQEPRLAMVLSFQSHAQELGPLEATHRDAELVGQALQELNFKVSAHQDLSLRQLEAVTASWIAELKAAGPAAVGFFYFSGHCWADARARRNYLVANEELPRAREILRKEGRSPAYVNTVQAALPRLGLPLRQLTHALNAASNRANFIVIDSHLDAPEPELLAGPAGSREIATNAMLVARGRPGVPAHDDNTFSSALADALRSPGLDAQAVFKQVQMRVAESTKGRQLPWIEDRLVRPYSFRPGRAEPAVGTTGRRVALVIGNAQYRHAGLLFNPTNDARAIAKTLRSMGFAAVHEHMNLERQAFQTALSQFQAQAREAELALIYYAGHGLESAGRNFLVPIDAQVASDEQLEEETIPVAQVLDHLAGVKQARILILDACRENPFPGAHGARSSAGLAEMEARPGTLIALAADPGQPSYDGEGEHSPYAEALLKHLGERQLDARLMFGRVYESLSARMQGRQEAWIQAKLSGRPVYLNP